MIYQPTDYSKMAYFDQIYDNFQTYSKAISTTHCAEIKVDGFLEF